ncbi:alkyl-dihydroxyacetone phosphate synthase [Trypanosoma vivax]|uniref:Alkylglycerone-phosphate synthase n=1 Tax=Trypanosoma vivax (strain Y486) TaxID=1055687 RepID=G0TWG3_TRYVY|nr:alkyl-dihydroxyacetone phosphate synthase [Trypanosoma vivax]CCC48301.1 alkyl-dihydroxyacetone phosphate synthase [Trypanosoma vivax Y486]
MRHQGNSDAYERIKWNGWGNAGKELTYDKGREVVVHTSGKPMWRILEFMRKDVQKLPGALTIRETPGLTMEQAIKLLPKPIVNLAFLNDLHRVLSDEQIRVDGAARLTHVFGKNYRDLWRVRRGLIDRAPDALLLPNNHNDCRNIMELAHKHNVVIIPFGGGTNVTGGVEPNPFETRRMIISVDMRRMGRMLKIDTDSGFAVFEAGVLGPDIDEQLGRHGFMLGHDPDSYTHSTLGGWIAARGSGAMSNKYGDIENMVLALKVVTPVGVVETPLTSRPCGCDLNAMFTGSDGSFGIITEATVKIERIPETKRYEGWFFPQFEDAFAAFHACTCKGIHPCTMRLYDEDDTRLSFAASTDHGWVSTTFSKCFKKYLERVKRWNMDKISLVIVGYEGSKAQTRCQRSELSRVFASFGGLHLGKKPGASWQEKKYDLPYLRDFALAHNYWADVFETSVLYSNAIRCWREVKQVFKEVMEKNQKVGWIGCHSAHQYRYGCCLYFTFIGVQTDENDLKVFIEIKKRAMEVMLKHHGNLTHHHGIGYEHVPWMEQYHGKVGLDVMMRFKRSIDPQNICNPGKLLPSPLGDGDSDGSGDKTIKARQEREMMFDKMGIPGAVKAHL